MNTVKELLPKPSDAVNAMTRLMATGGFEPPTNAL